MNAATVGRSLAFIGLGSCLIEFSAARWRVERALEESDDRFRSMAETVPEIRSA
jgi:hypothetical protein